jgi:hypothetical protein
VPCAVVVVAVLLVQVLRMQYWAQVRNALVRQMERGHSIDLPDEVASRLPLWHIVALCATLVAAEVGADPDWQSAEDATGEPMAVVGDRPNFANALTFGTFIGALPDADAANVLQEVRAITGSVADILRVLTPVLPEPGDGERHPPFQYEPRACRRADGDDGGAPLFQCDNPNRELPARLFHRWFAMLRPRAHVGGDDHAAREPLRVAAVVRELRAVAVLGSRQGMLMGALTGAGEPARAADAAEALLRSLVAAVLSVASPAEWLHAPDIAWEAEAPEAPSTERDPRVVYISGLPLNTVEADVRAWGETLGWPAGAVDVDIAAPMFLRPVALSDAPADIGFGVDGLEPVDPEPGPVPAPLVVRPLLARAVSERSRDEPYLPGHAGALPVLTADEAAGLTRGMASLCARLRFPTEALALRVRRVASWRVSPMLLRCCCGRVCVCVCMSVCVFACLQTLLACESAFEPYKRDLFPATDGRRRTKVVGSTLAPGYMAAFGWYPDAHVIGARRPPRVVKIESATPEMPRWAACMALASLHTQDGEEGIACCGYNIVMQMETDVAAQECVQLLAGELWSRFTTCSCSGVCFCLRGRVCSLSHSARSLTILACFLVLPCHARVMGVCGCVAGQWSTITRHEREIMPTFVSEPLDTNGGIAYSVCVKGVPVTCTRVQFNDTVRGRWPDVHSAYLPPGKTLGFVNFVHWRGFIAALSCSGEVCVCVCVCVACVSRRSHCVECARVCASAHHRRACVRFTVAATRDDTRSSRVCPHKCLDD